MSEDKKVIVIVGGVAGGASCAARLRRLREHDDIILLEKGPYVSYANCGLPYYVGDVIKEEESLFVASIQLFKRRFNIDVRVNSEAVAFQGDAQIVTVMNHETKEKYDIKYDDLVLSPGAAAVCPPLPGIDLEGIFRMKTVPDSVGARKYIEEKKCKTAVVVGAGFIGLEMVENLVARGLETTVIDFAPQVLPPLDLCMAAYVQQRLENNGVKVLVNEAVASFEKKDGLAIEVTTSNGKKIQGDIIILAIGVKPVVAMAQAAGTKVGEFGAMVVDDMMKTNIPHVWAVGDAVETKNVVTDRIGVLPLAGPANREGRLCADNIAGHERAFRGVQGTAVVGVFGLTAAMTGVTEKELKKGGHDDYEVVYVHQANHVGYYPGGKVIHMKLIFKKADGRVLGCQAIGEAGVEKRIDVVAMAIQMKGTVFDLEECELCYAPQFGSAKDPVNLAGFIGANVMRGLIKQASWRNLPEKMYEILLVDVRSKKEYEAGHVTGALNCNVDEMRQNLDMFPKDKEIWVYCGIGKRSYVATRLLMQHGFNVRNVAGGWMTFATFASTHQGDSKYLKGCDRKQRCSDHCNADTAPLS